MQIFPGPKFKVGEIVLDFRGVRRKVRRVVVGYAYLLDADPKSVLDESATLDESEISKLRGRKPPVRRLGK